MYPHITVRGQISYPTWLQSGTGHSKSHLGLTLASVFLHGLLTAPASLEVDEVDLQGFQDPIMLEVPTGIHWTVDLIFRVGVRKVGHVVVGSCGQQHVVAAEHDINVEWLGQSRSQRLCLSYSGFPGGFGLGEVCGVGTVCLIRLVWLTAIHVSLGVHVDSLLVEFIVLTVEWL